MPVAPLVSYNYNLLTPIVAAGVGVYVIYRITKQMQLNRLLPKGGVCCSTVPQPVHEELPPGASSEFASIPFHSPREDRYSALRVLQMADGGGDVPSAPNAAAWIRKLRNNAAMEGDIEAAAASKHIDLPHLNDGWRIFETTGGWGRKQPGYVIGGDVYPHHQLDWAKRQMRDFAHRDISIIEPDSAYEKRVNRTIDETWDTRFTSVRGMPNVAEQFEAY